MRRREFLSTVGSMLSASQRASDRQPYSSKSPRPNIVLLMADQWRFDCMGAYGNKVVRTPNLDHLAAEGTRFSCAYSSTPTCTPARSALLTGLSPWHHGMLGMTNMASRYPFEKARALAEARYRTIAIGNNHYHPIRNAHGYQQMIVDEHCSYWFSKNTKEAVHSEASGEERCDYEAWFWSQLPTGDPHASGLSWNDHRGRAFPLPEQFHATRWTGDTAVNFLRTYNKPDPFFLKVSFIRPHSPYDPPARFFRMYEDADLPRPFVARWAERYEQRSDAGNNIWHGKLDASEVRRSRQGYYGSVSFVDEQIGRILGTLEERKMLEGTAVIFLSDHGDMLGDQNLWRKSYAYEPSARIPMLLRLPSGLQAERGMVVSQPVELRDVLPTLLELAGAAQPDHMDGASLLSLIQGKKERWRSHIDLEHNICYSPANHWNALSDGTWKYIFHAQEGEEQLFHLAEDPHEMSNLVGVGKHEVELRKWRNHLIEHLSERGDRFVKNGKLALRPQGMMLSPNFPGYAS